jgi:hypothetical protein
MKAATATLPSGEAITVYFDPASKLIAGFDALDTESMLGDAPSQYVFADYKDVGGLKLPHKLTIRQLGQPYSELRIASAEVNDAATDATFAIPASANDDVNKALIARDYYAAVTHHHYDHTGGVRGLAAVRATILAEKGHEPAMRMIVETPHTNPPDALENARKAGKAGDLKLFTGKLVLSDGKQTLELYSITGNPHVEPKVIAYVPSARALFQSDLWSPGLGAPAGPEAVHLLRSIDALKLLVATHVGGHGGVGPHAELVKAVAAVKQ